MDNSGGYLDNSGTLNNFGHLDNSGHFSYLQNAGTLINAGRIAGNGGYIQTAGQTVNNGSFSQESIQINGGSLSGTGTITGDVTIGSMGIVSPGNSPGILIISGNFHSSGSLISEIAGTGAGQYDALVINGNATFTGGNIEFDFINGFHAAAGDHWNFLLADSITGWNTLNVTVNGLGAGLRTEFTYDSVGEHLLITTAIPEPETYAMFLAGLGVMGFMARRRKTA